MSVALSGNTAVIGAVCDDNSSINDAGSAYIFVRSGSTWTEQAKIVASDAGANDEFGVSVAISGDTVLVGAARDDNTAGIDAGSVYVFSRKVSSWSEQARLVASNATKGKFFGNAIAMSGAAAVIGSFNASSAYIFGRTNGLWSEQAILTPSNGGGYFGWSVAIHGDMLLVGAPNDAKGGVGAGAAFLYTGMGSSWTEQAKLTATDASEGDAFGWSVGVFGDVAVSGAALDDQEAGTFAGSAYLFDLHCLGLTDGACCLDGVCAHMRQVTCDTIGGVFVGIGVTCDAAKCDPPCPADIDGRGCSPDGAVDVTDLLLLLGAWGACP
jgi:hypothetical protein